ncbi:MAG: hypothetical protein RBR63_01715 [Methanosarcina vacuolata]|jgi:hypothetical protein|nr:hypothetical protein [Methanosarcina vacuolata]
MFKSANMPGFIVNVVSNTQFYLEEPIVGIPSKKDQEEDFHCT